MEHHTTTDPVLVCFVVYGLAYAVFYWFSRAPKTRDPWDADVENLMNDPEAAPLCYRCLEPQHHHGWFCPNCGAAVGPFNNCMPYVYAFSEGEVLRAGVTLRVRRSPFIIAAYLIYSLFSYVIIFAPIYWYFFFRNLKSQPEETETEPG